MSARKLSVLQVLPALESGGVERGTLEVGRALRDIDPGFTVQTFSSLKRSGLDEAHAKLDDWFGIGAAGVDEQRLSYTLEEMYAATELEELEVAPASAVSAAAGGAASSSIAATAITTRVGVTSRVTRRTYMAFSVPVTRPPGHRCGVVGSQVSGYHARCQLRMSPAVSGRGTHTRRPRSTDPSTRSAALARSG